MQQEGIRLANTLNITIPLRISTLTTLRDAFEHPPNSRDDITLPTRGDILPTTHLILEDHGICQTLYLLHRMLVLPRDTRSNHLKHCRRVDKHTIKSPGNPIPSTLDQNSHILVPLIHPSTHLSKKSGMMPAKSLAIVSMLY